MGYSDIIILGDGSVFVDDLVGRTGGSRTCNRDLLHLVEANDADAQAQAMLEVVFVDHPGEKWCSSPYQERVHPQNGGWLPVGEFSPNSQTADKRHSWCKHCRAYAERLHRQHVAESEGRSVRPRRANRAKEVDHAAVG